MSPDNIPRPAPPVEPQTNTLALVGFILSFLMAPVGVVLSIVGLTQIKKEPLRYKGKELAIAGIIIGGIITCLPIIFLILGLVLAGLRGTVA